MNLTSMPRGVATALSAITLALTAACSMPKSMSMSASPKADAVASLQPKSNSTVAGTVSFAAQGEDRVRVVARVSGLKPNQEHGFHVHEKGDCSSPDGNSAGGHFNPTAQLHGPQTAPHHGGDMPSLKADASGNADASFTIDGSVGKGGSADLVGKAVIVHEKPDDYTTQPTGNTGGRIACGVIGAAQ
jgi:superoxide dismutase, Cu-Zn family